MKFTDIQSAFGIEQMKKLPARVVRKREIFKYYRENLSEVAEFVPTNLSEVAPTFVDIILRNEKEREGLHKFLAERNIGSRAVYSPLHRMPVYEMAFSTPVAEDFGSRGLQIPSPSFLTNTQLQSICEVIKDGLAQIRS
jgi:dTDP-4-amino-4,6-dideoxygalactose transaminase